MTVRLRYLHFVVVSAFAMCIQPCLKADGIANVSAGSASVAVGDVFDIPVSVSNVSDLYAFQFDLSFDPTILELLNISEGSFLPTAGTTFFIPGTIDNTAGTATATADTLIGAIPGATGSGDLADFEFEALALGTTALTLANVSLLDSSLNPIAFSTTNGQVMVSSTVPEPSSMPVLGAMLACTLLAVRKFRNRAA
jgi:hypothetical protein